MCYDIWDAIGQNASGFPLEWWTILAARQQAREWLADHHNIQIVRGCHQDGSFTDEWYAYKGLEEIDKSTDEFGLIHRCVVKVARPEQWKLQKTLDESQAALERICAIRYCSPIETQTSLASRTCVDERGQWKGDIRSDEPGGRGEDAREDQSNDAPSQTGESTEAG